jgi:hypothetical protein
MRRGWLTVIVCVVFAFPGVVRGQAHEVNKDILNTGDQPQVGFKVVFRDPVDIVLAFRGPFQNITYANPPGTGHDTDFICWTNPVAPIEPDTGVHVGWVSNTLVFIVEQYWTDLDCNPVPGAGRNVTLGIDFGGQAGREGGRASMIHLFQDGGEPPGPITLSDIRYLTSNQCFPLEELNAQNETLNEQLLSLEPGPITLGYGETFTSRIPGGVRRSRYLYTRYDVSGDDGAFARDWIAERPLTWKWDWPDYATGGVPDLSQDHASFPPDDDGHTTYDGPAALANCLWWYDSQMEGRCGGFPGDGEDDYPLVRAYGAVVDDHAPENAEPLIQQLASCARTDSAGPGTRMDDLEACATAWIDGAGEAQNYTVQRIPSPTFEQIVCEVERSENVIVQLGFWWSVDGGSSWSRCGGHYVTAAGANIRRDPGVDGLPGEALIDDDQDGEVDEEDELCPCDDTGIVTYGDDECGVTSDDVCGGMLDMIALSDPGKNNAEPPPYGNAARARVRGAEHSDHAPAITPPPSHDDVANASHDSYEVVDSITGRYNGALRFYGTPGAGFPTECGDVDRWCGQNPSEAGDPMQACTGSTDERIAVEIESMLGISPVVTPVCIDLTAGVDDIRLHKGGCPGPSSTMHRFGHIRGELCQVRAGSGVLDLGEVDCLASDSPWDQRPDRSTWDATRGIGAWLFLVRQDMTTDYGRDSDGRIRMPASGDCP